ncbi:MAG: tellurite resistance/C4-dicarboxylate transporter family protein [Bacteroidetes bacterium]|jgi:tellurite resistance protein TehA-like permease|nr:tellurite resistance/C4-dicarboxylate transporter family protein [Bacteroidota bacterium]MBS1981522.1 tellurite resistance/C4-dicarboxylate transporter family protein [Bacteroidota bacterium]
MNSPNPYQNIFLSRIKEMIKTHPPVYFGLVMSTGIISIAAHLLGNFILGEVLFWLNLVAYLFLWVLNLIRLFFYTYYFLDDIHSHQRGPGFFTAIAGTCILGSQFIIIREDYITATFLWVIGVILWVVITYIIFTTLTIKEKKPPLSEGITGAWLLAVVSTQSIAVLTTLIASHWDQPYKLEANFFALSMWLWGGMLYIWMISLIFYRYTFFKFSPGDLAPPYWINMGAMAISALAGSLLIINVDHAPFLLSLLPFLKGFTVFYWATGTWWIPMLVILAVWRHAYKKFPLTYDPQYWGAVFPLGMYTVATLRMAHALSLDFLLPLPHYFIYVALCAWAITFAGMLRSLILLFITHEKKVEAD